MNKTLIAERFTKAVHTYGDEAEAQKRIAEHMASLLSLHLHGFWPNRIAEFGCGTGNYSRLLYKQYYPKEMLMNDICGEMRHCCKELLDRGVRFVAGDAEHFDFPKECELITSCSTLQWFENPNGFFEHCSQYLVQKGYLVFSTFGPDNMKEVMETTGHGLTYRSLSELTKGLQPYYEIIHAEEQMLTYHFDHPMSVLRHLKQTGVTGISSQQWTRGRLKDFCAVYQQRFKCSQGVSLTYHPLYIIAKKKNHEE